MNEEFLVKEVSKIETLCGRLRVLGQEVVELQRVVNKKRAEYLGVNAIGVDKPDSPDGTLNDMEWMLGDILAMVRDVREYVDTI